nr:acidic fibroblast growth factor intracellular-binding protein-like [Ciona intestinalis]|eukprot:XP_002125334.1 acidic fibroblast growth factor intracellular-binding protein-like [Ciona intestinalis]
MEIIPDVDVFVGNNIHVDFEIYHYWLRNIGADEVTDLLVSSGASNISHIEINNDDFEKSLLYSHVLDQYRLFSMVEPMVQVPTVLCTQLTYQISHKIQESLVSNYYELDDQVVREILGKKLSKGTRRDLDEVAAKTHKRLRFCHRQFDNCKRIFKTLEDWPGSLLDNIQTKFLLPQELAWKYTVVVFLSSLRFECCKRKLAYLTTSDFIECGKLMIQNWTAAATGSENPETELDRDFLNELRSVRVLSADQKICEKHRHLISQEMEKTYPTLSQASRTPDQSSQSRLSRVRSRDSSKDLIPEALFLKVTRGLVTIASNLYRTKEAQDFFIDVVEKVIEPLQSCSWSKSKVEHFLDLYSSTALQFTQMQQLSEVWKKFSTTAIQSIVKMYYPSKSVDNS